MGMQLLLHEHLFADSCCGFSGRSGDKQVSVTGESRGKALSRFKKTKRKERLFLPTWEKDGVLFVVRRLEVRVASKQIPYPYRNIMLSSHNTMPIQIDLIS